MATMISGLGGPAGYGENAFSGTTKIATGSSPSGPNDDASVLVDISSVFSGGIDFFGTTYTSIYINSNGLITFDGPEVAYNPVGLAGYASPAIAPFWSDIDIEQGGEIYWDLDPGGGKVTITWLDVSPYASSSAINSFQVVLTDTGGGDFDVQFIYEDIQWSNGGGGTATAGVTDGGANDYEVAGSGNDTSVQNWDNTDFDGAGPDPSGVFSIGIEGGVPTVVVDGTSGDDTMALGYTDTDGDQITAGADSIDGGAGADSIDGSTGDDTIDGGAGNDTILSGSTSGSIAWTTVNPNANLTGTTGQDYYSFVAGNGDNATIRFNNSAGSGDGDGVADYVRIETTNQTGTLTIGDFDMGLDKIVLQQMYTGIASWTNTGYYDVQITYSGGNIQTFRIYTDDGFLDTSQVFTTTEPTGSASDSDSLLGGDGADTFVISDSFGSDTIVGGEGGTDSDTIDLTALTGAVTVTFSGDEAGSITDGTDTLTFSEIEKLILTAQSDSVDAASVTSALDVVAGDGADTILTGSGNDTIDGGSGNDSIVAGGGSDSIVADAGSDTIDAGDGADTINGGGGDDSVLGGAGADLITDSGGSASNDTIDGGAGNDTIDAGLADDTILGGTGDDSITGGAGNDSITGGDGDDTFVYTSGDGADTISDFNTGASGTLNDGNAANNDFVDLSPFYDNLSELYADQADDGILNQSNATDTKGRAVDYGDNVSFGAGSLTFTGASADNTSFTAENTNVVCFTAGTAIRTPRGDVLIEELRVGDRVCTLDSGPKPIIWIGRRQVMRAELAACPNLRPILMPRGTLSAERNLLLSPLHGVLLSPDTLVRARLLTDVPGCRARIAHGKRSVTYMHLLLERHEIVFAENVPAETFYPGPFVSAVLGRRAIASLRGALPHIDISNPLETYGQPARYFARRKDVVGAPAGEGQSLT